jgi:hypothetical protein
VSFATAQGIAHFFFGLAALGAPRELAASSTGEESTRPKTLQHDHDGYGLVAREGAMGEIERLSR